MNENETHETIITTTTTTTGILPVGEEPRPVPAPEEFIQPRGSFASGEETTPEKDAADRQDRGSFASGEETTPGRIPTSASMPAAPSPRAEETPKKDAAERVHPGTFADSEPEAEPTA
jgi:transcription antitermination factor NusG